VPPRRRRGLLLAFQQEEGVALAEAGGRGPVGGPEQPVRGARAQRFGGEGTDHPAALDDIVEFHAGQRRPVSPFGMASGSFAPVTPDLAQAHRVSVRAAGATSPAELMALVRTALTEAAAGRIRPVIGQEFGLAAAAEAHAAIEARTTIGKTLLTVP
jgi:hypothetical protein